MIEDHRGVVSGAGAITEQTASLAQLLDREILPCLERPGQMLGPFGVPPVKTNGRRRVALIWPTEADDAFVPEPVRPLFDSAHFPRESELKLCTLPAAEFESVLLERGLPCAVRPDWSALPENPLWLAWIDHPLQILGLLSILRTSKIAARCSARELSDPRLLITGPATRLLPDLCAVFADAVIDPDKLSQPGLIDALSDAAHSGAAEFDRVASECGALTTKAEATAQIEIDHEWTETPGGRPRGRGTRPVTCVELASFGQPWQQREEHDSRPTLEHFYVGAGSASLREKLGFVGADALTGSLTEALGDEVATVVLHFVLGLPHETEADRLAIADFIDCVAKSAPRGAKQVRVEIAELLPMGEENRPAWSPLMSAQLDRILDRVQVKRVQINSTSSGEAAVLWSLRDLGAGGASVLEALHAAGVRQAEDVRAVDGEFWAKALGLDSGAPSEIVEATEAAATGLPKRFAVVDPNAAKPASKYNRNRKNSNRKNRWQRWQAIVPHQFDHRIEYSVQGRSRLMGPGDTADLFLSACVAAELPLAYAGVVQPKPKMSFGPALASGLEGIGEYVDLSLTTKVDDVLERLRPWMPEGLTLHACAFMPGGASRFPLSRIYRAEYEAELCVEQFHDAAAFEQDRARVCSWERRLLEGLKCGLGETDTLDQLCEIRWMSDSSTESVLRFALDLSREGVKCKPREVLERALEGISKDSRLIPLRRLRMLSLEVERGRAKLRTPLEQVRRDARLWRSRQRFCA